MQTATSAPLSVADRSAHTLAHKNQTDVCVLVMEGARLCAYMRSINTQQATSVLRPSNEGLLQLAGCLAQSITIGLAVSTKKYLPKLPRVGTPVNGEP